MQLPLDQAFECKMQLPAYRARTVRMRAFNVQYVRTRARARTIALPRQQRLDAMAFACSMCSFYAKDDVTLVSHVCKIHRHDPNFLVYCSRCLRSFRVWDTYKKHRYRGCKENASSSTSEGGSRESDDNEDSTMDFSEYVEESNSQPSKLKCALIQFYDSSHHIFFQ